jgi:hypothetical protein
VVAVPQAFVFAFCLLALALESHFPILLIWLATLLVAVVAAAGRARLRSLFFGFVAAIWHRIKSLFLGRPVGA